MGGGNKQKTSTQTYKPASWIESSARQANQMASQYARQPWREYGGERVAALSENEQMGVDVAKAGTGSYKPDLASARSSLEGVETFDQFDADAYMNPYIKGALDPAARELGERGAQRRNELEGQLTSKGAFSGSRAALAVRDQDELTQQGISDLYGTGYADAFDKGAALWSDDQNRRITQAGSFMELAGMGSDLLSADTTRLMMTGETQRNVDQAMKDFDYGQFVEQRDWGGRQAAYMADMLRSLKGSYTETQTGVTEGGGENQMGEIIGGIASAVGAYFMMASDPAIKSNIQRIGYLESNGLGVYEYDINGHHLIGTMADEVEALFPEAVQRNQDGVMMVNYSMIDWREDNFRLEIIVQEAA